MVCEVPVTRRTFLKAMGSGVVTVTVSTIPALLGGCAAPHPENQPTPKSAPIPETSSNSSLDWAPEPGKARWRIEGVRKVTGSKIYARDFKARDFDGWPSDENWLYALRCNRVDRVVEDFDLGILPHHLKPIFVVTNDTLRQHQIPTSTTPNPESNRDIYLFAQKGEPAGCYGQPVALLIFENFDTYRRARKHLDFNEEVIRYGKPVSRSLSTVDPFDDQKTINSVKIYVRNDEHSFWNTSMDANDFGNPTPEFKEMCRAERDEVCALAAQKVRSREWREFGTSDGTHFRTPAMDPVFMEPESGLAWYRSDTGSLKLVLGTQSPRDDGESAVTLLKDSDVGLKEVHVVGCFPGGGFGGRDKSYFPLYLALAAPFAKGPLRWQMSRYEQFQVGLKRSETLFEESIWVDRNGKIQALDSKFLLNAGGKQNLTPAVGDLAAMSAMSCYDIPRACAQGTTTYTPEVFGGSQRGFGGPQAFMAIETLVDEAAFALRKSPFEIRRANLLSPHHGKTITGGQILFDLQLNELLKPLEAHPLWASRQRTRAERWTTRKLKYGVGLAMSNQAYGTGKDGVFAMVEIQQNGTLRVLTHYVDMGNGAATTLALAPASHLGQNAQAISMSEVDAFVSIPGFNSKALGLWPKDCRAKGLSGPFGSSSACLGAFHHFQAVDRASKALMLDSVLPAARLLWRDQKIQLTDVRWVKGTLTTAGHSALTWPQLLDQLNRIQRPTVAAVHVTYAGGFWTSKYPFKSGDCDMDCDFIAMGPDTHNLVALKHGELIPPQTDVVGYGRTNYAPAAALVAVSVAPDSGQVKVEHVITTLSAGHLICPEIVQGQSQGAVAMAIGNVLSERCPLGPNGPGNGTWNLDQYLITRMADVPQQELILLPPPEDNNRDCARGIGEAVMCPVAPALLNALAMATGRRFRQTPVTPDIIREAFK